MSGSCGRLSSFLQNARTLSLSAPPRHVTSPSVLLRGHPSLAHLAVPNSPPRCFSSLPEGQTQKTETSPSPTRILLDHFFTISSPHLSKSSIPNQAQWTRKALWAAIQESEHKELFKSMNHLKLYLRNAQSQKKIVSVQNPYRWSKKVNPLMKRMPFLYKKYSAKKFSVQKPNPETVAKLAAKRERQAIEDEADVYRRNYRGAGNAYFKVIQLRYRQSQERKAKKQLEVESMK